MPKCYYSNRRIRLYHGDALDISRQLGDGLAGCIVTSPPYFGLRDYGVDDQYGLEKTPDEYVKTLRDLFSELRRVLADDGTLWLNLGDSYASSSTSNGGYSASSTLVGFTSPNTKGRRANDSTISRRTSHGIPAKNLLGIPWRVAFALQDDGWILRNALVWNKPNAMPESVTDRLSNKYEHVFLFSKKQRYHFDLDVLREPHADVSIKRAQSHRTAPGRSAREGAPYAGITSAQTLCLDQNHPKGKNPGDVWSIATTPFGAAHFAVYPVELAQRAILAGCKPGGTVLDPFSGSGTTGRAALNTKRRFVGIDINADYLKMSLAHPNRFAIDNPKVRHTP